MHTAVSSSFPTSLRTTFLQGWHLFWMVHTRRYRSTFLGYVWMLVEPLATVLPLLLVGGALNLADSNATQMPYLIYAFSGAMLWQAFAAVLGQVMTTFKTARKKARRLQLDPLAPVFFAVFHSAIGLCFSFVIFLVLAAINRFPLSPAVLLFPIPALIMCAAAVLVALPFVLADAVYRDAQRVLTFVISFIFWTVPVVHFPPEGTFLQTVVRWNPLTPAFVTWRGLLTGDAGLGSMSLLASVAAIAVLLVLMARFFTARFWEALDYVR